MALKAQSSRLRTPDAAGIGRGGRWSVVTGGRRCRISNIEHRTSMSWVRGRDATGRGLWLVARGSWLVVRSWIGLGASKYAYYTTRAGAHAPKSVGDPRPMRRSRSSSPPTLAQCASVDESRARARARVREAEDPRRKDEYVSQWSASKFSPGSTELDRGQLARSGGARRRCDSDTNSKTSRKV